MTRPIAIVSLALLSIVAAHARRAAASPLDCQAPTISQQPLPASTRAGTTATFSITASGTEPLTYQWYNTHTYVPTPIPDATGPTLTIDLVSECDSHQYECVVTNGCGSATSDPASLEVPFGMSAQVVGVWGPGSLVPHYDYSLAINHAGDVVLGIFIYQEIQTFTPDATPTGTPVCPPFSSFNPPTGVAVDSHDNIWAVGGGAHQAIRTGACGVDPTLVLGHVDGSPGTEDGAFDGPFRLAVDGADNVFVGDRTRIQKFDAAGNFVDKLEVSAPLGIAVDGSGYVYAVVDQPDGVVYKYDWATKAIVGKFLPMANCSDPQGNACFGIALDPCGRIYLSGPEKMFVLNPLGNVISRFGVTGSEPGQFAEPLDIAVNPTTGVVYVADYSNARVQAFQLGAGGPCENTAADPVQAPDGAARLRVAPSPFRTAAHVSFTMAQTAGADVGVYDVGGRRVRQLAAGVLSAGSHEFTWDGMSDTGESAHAGVYFVRVHSNGLLLTQRVARIP